MHRTRPLQATHDPFLRLQRVPDPAASSFLHVVLAVPRHQVTVFENVLFARPKLIRSRDKLVQFPSEVTEQKRPTVCQLGLVG